MNNVIRIPEPIFNSVRSHLFQDERQQAAFLFARELSIDSEWVLLVEDFYLVPAEAWEVQDDLYLQMSDSYLRSGMRLALKNDSALIDCHSHPHSVQNVWFSSSDVAGITQFSRYVKWKLKRKPFAALVWGEASMDAVLWKDDFVTAERVDRIAIQGSETSFIPNGSWFRSRASHTGFEEDMF